MNARAAGLMMALDSSDKDGYEGMTSLDSNMSNRERLEAFPPTDRHTDNF